MGAGKGGGRRRREEQRAASCRMQTFRSVCNRVFHVGMPPASIAKCWLLQLVLQAARGMPARLPRAVALSGPGSPAPPLPTSRGCSGGGAPKWLPCLELRDRRSFPSQALARPAKSCFPWGAPAESQPVLWLLERLQGRQPGWSGKRHTRLSSDARLLRVFTAPLPPGSARRKEGRAGGARDLRAGHAAVASAAAVQA